MRLHFHMSEGQAEHFPDWAERELEVETDGDVQLVYRFLQDDNGVIATLTDEDYWLANADGKLYSDIGIAGN